MESILTTLNIDPETFEAISYFSSELFLIFGIVLNLIFFLFFKRKLNIKRISDFITSSIFILNSLIISAILIKSLFFVSEINYSTLNNLIIISKNELTIKLLINIFMFGFIISTYKLTRKARFKTPLINSLLLLIALSSYLLIQSQNFILIYILLDLSTILIYKYASNIRIRKNNYFSIDFVAISTCASILFFSFYILTFFIKDSIQLNIIYVCILLVFWANVWYNSFNDYVSQNQAKKGAIKWII